MARWSWGIRQFKCFPRRDGENVNDSQRKNPKPILKKQVNNTNQIETYRRNQNDIRRQYVNSSGMQNSMQGDPTMANIWRPQPENFPDRFDLMALNMVTKTYTHSKNSVCIFSYNSRGFGDDKQDIL